MIVDMSVPELTLIQKIKENQLLDLDLAKIANHIAKRPDFRIVDEVLYFHDRLCIPKSMI